jgi:hypothetical protein
LANNVVAENRAGLSGAGLYVWASSPRLLHTTIAGNTGGEGSGIYVGDWSNSYSYLRMTNTILVSQTVGITVSAGNTAAMEATLWGSGSWANGDDWEGAGLIITGTLNYWDDPRFLQPGAADYHLSAASAAIDAGVDAAISVDIDRDPRPIGPGYDIGADEAPLALSVVKLASPEPVRAGAPLTYTILVTHTADIDLHATITDTLPEQVSPGGVLTWTALLSAPGGMWTETFSVVVDSGYTGTLTNIVSVATAEGIAATHVRTTQVFRDPYWIYLPLVLQQRVR